MEICIPNDTLFEVITQHFKDIRHVYPVDALGTPIDVFATRYSTVRKAGTDNSMATVPAT